MSSNNKQDPHQGGDLFDMAKDGTTIPNDAGKMNIIPSVPRPGEGEGVANGNGGASLASAASNARDISRGVTDIGATGEVETGTGDILPASIETKNLHNPPGPNNPLAKGSSRYDKHTRQKGTEFDEPTTEGSGIDVESDERI